MCQNNDRRSLSFAPSHSSRLIPSLEAIENKENLWFSDEELKETSSECIRTVVDMLRGMPLKDDSDQFTNRGLEYMTPDGFDIAASSHEAIRALLDEQERQRKVDGEVDSELLASAIAPISRHRMRIAQLKGQKDERMAYIVHNRNRNSWSDSSNTSSGASTEEAKKRIAERRRGRMTQRSLSPSAPGHISMDIVRRRRASRGSLFARRSAEATVVTSNAALEGSKRISDSSVVAFGTQQLSEDANLSRLSLQA